MLPKPPPREASLGFLYVPPFRIQGVSVAGEATCVQIPEMDVCFDMGLCPRASLPARWVAISHGHMDHVGGLAYWCSQRVFQGMGPGHIICDARIEHDVRAMMAGYVGLERQTTPYNLTALSGEGQIEIKNNIILRAFECEHSAPSMGYVLIEHRTKLKPEFLDYPQEKLRELKDRGVEITRTLEIPLIAYIGDTGPGPHLIREDVRKAQVIVSECTFFEPDHKERARGGMHMHVDDIGEWLRVCECQAMILTHVSRRTHTTFARDRIAAVCGTALARKVFLLMDYKANKERYERQLDEAERLERQRRRSGPRDPAPEARAEG